MTANQISYARLQEDVRHNREVEAYNNRYLKVQQRGQDMQYQASIYGAQLNYQANVYSAQMHYAATQYSADSARQASMYASDSSRVSSNYNAQVNYIARMNELNVSQQNANTNSYNADTNRWNTVLHALFKPFEIAVGLI